MYVYRIPSCVCPKAAGSNYGAALANGMQSLPVWRPCPDYFSLFYNAFVSFYLDRLFFGDIMFLRLSRVFLLVHDSRAIRSIPECADGYYVSHNKQIRVNPTKNLSHTSVAVTVNASIASQIE